MCLLDWAVGVFARLVCLFVFVGVWIIWLLIWITDLIEVYFEGFDGACVLLCFGFSFVAFG